MHTNLLCDTSFQQAEENVSFVCIRICSSTLGKDESTTEKSYTSTHSQVTCSCCKGLGGVLHGVQLNVSVCCITYVFDRVLDGVQLNV